MKLTISSSTFLTLFSLGNFWFTSPRHLPRRKPGFHPALARRTAFIETPGPRASVEYVGDTISISSRSRSCPLGNLSLEISGHSFENSNCPHEVASRDNALVVSHFRATLHLFHPYEFRRLRRRFILRSFFWTGCRWSRLYPRSGGMCLVSLKAIPGTLSETQALRDRINEINQLHNPTMLHSLSIVRLSRIVSPRSGKAANKQLQRVHGADVSKSGLRALETNAVALIVLTSFPLIHRDDSHEQMVVHACPRFNPTVSFGQFN